MKKAFTIKEIELVLKKFAEENHLEWKFYFLPIIRNKLNQYKGCKNAI